MQPLLLIGGVFVILVIIFVITSQFEAGEATSMHIDEEEAQEAAHDVASGEPPEPPHVQTPEEKAEEEEYFEET